MDSTDLRQSFSTAGGALWEQLCRWLTVRKDQPEEQRREQRWLAHEPVGLFFLDSDGEIQEARGNLVDRSQSGVRLWSARKVEAGEKFLIVDSLGREGEARAVWAETQAGGTLVGARVDWVGKVLPERNEAKRRRASNGS